MEKALIPGKQLRCKRLEKRSCISRVTICVAQKYSPFEAADPLIHDFELAMVWTSGHAATIFYLGSFATFCMPFMMVLGYPRFFGGFGLWFLDGTFNYFGSLSTKTFGFETRWLPKILWVFEVNVGWPFVCGEQSLLLSRSYSFSGRWEMWLTNWASHFMQRRAYCLGMKCRDLLKKKYIYISAILLN